MPRLAQAVATAVIATPRCACETALDPRGGGVDKCGTNDHAAPHEHLMCWRGCSLVLSTKDKASESVTS